MEPTLRVSRGQERLTSAQRAEAERFAEAAIQAQLSTEPVDEQEAEAFLWQAYEVVGLTAPRHIHWLDGPLELIAVLARESEWISVEDSFRDRVSHCVWDDSIRERSEVSRLRDHVSESVDYRVRSVQKRVRAGLPAGFGQPWGAGVAGGVWNSIGWIIQDRVRTTVGERLWLGIGNSVGYRPVYDRIRDRGGSIEESSLWHSICAYDEADELANLLFLDTYFASNEAHALARFNQLVSGYWLGKELALIVRRPRVLSLDTEGRLHNATGKCIEYHDGWGFYAWHGVRVPERVILTPEALTRDDFLREGNIETRRVIMEQMGQRFVWELEGKFIDGGPHGVLYEVALPGDPERVARYVHVQDASTPHQYYLRVPPTIQTAAEAVAWSFGLSVEKYHPAQET
jgi:hypothetical protein